MRAGNATRRARLIRPAPLGALVAVALGGIAALQLRSRAAPPELPEPGRDPLTLPYLRAWIDRYPHDVPMRLRLSREELALGRYEEAEQTLAPLLDGRAAPAREAASLSLEIAVAAWRASPVGTAARTDAENRVLARLDLLSGRDDASAPGLAQLAAVARELGRPRLAARCLERAAAVAPAECGRWRAEAARDLLAAADPSAAASTFARAYECSEGAAARDLGLEALAAYLAADEGQAALRWAERLAERYPADREILERAERIALAEDDPARARRFGVSLVDLGQSDAVALRRLLDLHLGAGDLDGATQVANRVVSLAPGDPQARLTAANVATWAGRRRLALDHWMWLARHTSDFRTAANAALPLARAIEDHAAVAELLRAEAERGPLSREALAELARALEHLGPGDHVIAALEEQVHRYPSSESAWEELAAAHERGEDLKGAVAAHREIAGRFGASRANSMRLARLQWALGRPADALAELRQWMDSSERGEIDYWELLAELAWDQEADEPALRAYEVLWRRRQIDATGAERLLLLHRGAGHTSEVIRCGREGWSRVDEPRLLLLAMDEAARARRWADLARLADEAARAPERFEGFPAYWMLRARMDEEAGRVAQAARAYRRALAADPGSPDARAGLIWLFVGAEDRSALSQSLAAWASDAADEPALWRPFAAGLELLGRRDEALAFYERDARANPQDAAAQERYVRALRRPAARSPTMVAVAELGVQSLGPMRWRRLEALAKSQARLGEVQVRARLSDFSADHPVLSLKREGAELLVGGAVPVFGGRTEVQGGIALRRDRSVFEAALAHTQPLAPFAEARLEAAINELAPESAVLLAEGLRSRAGGAVTLVAGPLYGRGVAEWKRWSSRAGSVLGAGGLGAMEVGLRIRAADPEIALRLNGSYQRNRVTPNPERRDPAIPPGITLLPDELSMLGLSAGAAGWRLGPARVLADAWVGWMTPPHRAAYRIQAGIALAPFERAELSLTGFAANDRWGGGGDFGVSASLAYRVPAVTP